MKTSIAVILLALLGAASAIAAGAVSKPLVVRMTWSVSIDADGHVVRLATTDQQIPAIHDRLEQAIRNWRFSPGKVNGKPTFTDSNLTIALALEPASDDTYVVHVIGAATGGSYGKITPPRYPHSSAMSRRQGLVVLKVSYSASGAVVAIALADGAPRVDSAFVEAATDAVREWTFKPEVVGGQALAGSARVPVCFSLRESHVPTLDCNWRRPGSFAAEFGDRAVALDPAATLLTDVVGRTL